MNESLFFLLLLVGGGGKRCNANKLSGEFEGKKKSAVVDFETVYQLNVVDLP